MYAEGKGIVMELLVKVLSRDNLLVALERVERNKGSAGIDGVSTEQLRDYIREHWLTIKEQIMKGTYKPSPVRRVEIPKSDGGVRLLGIPTVMDRFIQQAILQVLTPIFDPHFSESSFGFRPNRSAHDAMRQAQSYISEGYRFVVDMDLEKFFDRVNHDILMSRVARKVQDKALLKLLRAYLQAGIMVNGICLSAVEGTPQGGPLSPLLANILLDDLDKELEKRGHRFCRYADDNNIYVKTKRAGERVTKSIQNYLEKVLKLKVNEQKSAVDRPWKRKFLGFSFTNAKQARIRIHPKSLLKLKEKIRFITNPIWSISMDERIRKLNQYLMGWIGYFALADAKKILQSIEVWTRRRLRLCLWSQWKRIRTRYRELRSLGLSHAQAIEIANTRKGAWRTTKTPQIHKALGVAYWQQQGLKSLVQRYSVIRQA